MNRLIYVLYLGVLAIVSLSCIFTANRAKLRNNDNSLAASSLVDEYEASHVRILRMRTMETPTSQPTRSASNSKSKSPKSKSPKSKSPKSKSPKSKSPKSKSPKSKSPKSKLQPKKKTPSPKKPPPKKPSDGNNNNNGGSKDKNGNNKNNKNNSTGKGKKKNQNNKKKKKKAVKPKPLPKPSPPPPSPPPPSPPPPSPPPPPAHPTNQYQPQIFTSMIGFGSETTGMDAASWPYVASNIDGFWLNGARTDSTTVNNLINTANNKRGIVIYSIANAKVANSRLKSVKKAVETFDPIAGVLVRQGMGTDSERLAKDQKKFTKWTDAEITTGSQWLADRNITRWMIAMRQNAFPEANPPPPLNNILPRSGGGVFELPPVTVKTMKIFKGPDTSINRFSWYFKRLNKDQLTVWLAPISTSGTNYMADVIASLEILKRNDAVPDIIALANYGSTHLVWGPESNGNSWTHAAMGVINWRNANFPTSVYPKRY